MAAHHVRAEGKCPVLRDSGGKELCPSPSAPRGSSSTGLKYPRRGWGNARSPPNDLFIQQLLQEHQSIHLSALPSLQPLHFIPFIFFSFSLFSFAELLFTQ